MRIGTHDDRFHTDEVCAVAALLMLYPDAEIVRSRNPDVIIPCDILVDVGRVYYDVAHRYDHHQRGGAGTRPNGIEYASFGLIWRHYGDEITGNPEVTYCVDEMLVQAIDARDNGQQISIATETYGNIRSFAFADVIDAFNPHWDEPLDADTAFMRAVAFAKTTLERMISKGKSIVSARQSVRRAIAESEGRRVLLLGKGRPWQEVVVADTVRFWVPINLISTLHTANIRISNWLIVFS